MLPGCYLATFAKFRPILKLKSFKIGLTMVDFLVVVAKIDQN